MAQPLRTFSLSAPGFYGLNTADSPVDLPANFALQAENCVIDKSGRIGSRKGWERAHTANAQLSTSNVQCIGELITTAGDATLLAAGGGYLFKHGGTTLTTLTYGGGGVAPTISANNWKFCFLNGVAMFWQRGYDPLIYDPAVSTTTFRRLSEKSGSTGTIYQCNEALSAYGRVWAADTTTDKSTLVWSDLLTPHIWSGGTSGSLDLRNVWPAGGDEIVALAAHNNFLFIFGKRQILIYSGADTPADMRLTDSIVGIGCIARDSVQNIGEDIWFLSDTGLRSLMRTIQEKSAPISQLSKNIYNDLQTYVDAESAANIKSGYSHSDSYYVLSFPSYSRSYCFDTRTRLETGAAKVTTWTLAPTALCDTRERVFYLGMPGYVGEHTGYLDDTEDYRFAYYSTWMDFGDAVRTTILKKILLTLIGGTNQGVVFKWAYDYIGRYFSESKVITTIPVAAEYNIAEFNSGAEYAANTSVTTLSASGTSYGRLLQFGLEANISSFPMSIQKIDLFTKDGRY